MLCQIIGSSLCTCCELIIIILCLKLLVFEMRVVNYMFSDNNKFIIFIKFFKIIFYLFMEILQASYFLVR